MKRIFSLIIVGVIIALCWLAMPARAQNKAQAGDYLTKGEAAALLSASDLVKKKIGELFSWTVGYDISKVNRVRLTPLINYVKVIPKKAPPDGRTILELFTAVEDPGGLKNISGVRADMSSIGRLPNAMLVDNGLFGDTQAEDGIYSLQTSVSPKVTLGPKDITVSVVNKKGWLALAKTSLEVRKNPVIMEVQVIPSRTLANGRDLVTIAVKVDNPGRVEDLLAPVANLSVFGLSEQMPFRNDGEGGDLLPGDNVWTLRFAVPETAAPGEYAIPFVAMNLAEGVCFGRANLTVYK